MIFNIQKMVRVTFIAFFILLIGFIPLVLIYVGTKKTGINLHAALAGKSTLEPFIRLFMGSGSPEFNFRESLYRSIVYSTTVASIATFLAVFYTNWITGWTRKAAIGMSFTLLCLTLLPQTYLIMPILVIVQKLPTRPSEFWTIMIILLLGVLPLCFWVFHMMSGARIGDLQERCALDQLGLLGSLRRITTEIRVDLLLVFLLSWAVVWSNYLVPFSIGSRDSFTAVVQITTFTTNLGRDWAMICAAGFLVCIPGMVVGSILGTALIIKARVN